MSWKGPSRATDALALRSPERWRLAASPHSRKSAPRIIFLESASERGCEINRDVGGFHDRGADPKFPILISVSSDWKVQVHHEMVLPGDGNFPAQASLTARVYTRAIRANEALYCVYEAKKAAERVTSVGHVMIRHVTLSSRDG